MTNKWGCPPDAVWVWGKYGKYEETYCHAEEVKQEEFEIPVTKYIRADLAALPSSPVSELVERLTTRLRQSGLYNDAQLADEAADRLTTLETHNKLWQQNMREAYEAFSAMRNDLNELFPLQSAEADLLEGTEWSIACSAIVDAARDKFSTLEAQLAEAWRKEGFLTEKLKQAEEGLDTWKERAMRMRLTAAGVPTPARR